MTAITTTGTGAGGTSEDGGFALSPQQLAYFETFGFLKIPGLFADDIGWITERFEAVFASEHPRLETHEHLHLDDLRIIIPAFITKDEQLAGLLDDPRVKATVDGIMGVPWEYAESDGNLFYCESSWHPDTYSAPLTRFHLKLSFYLEPLSAESGAIRMIPGSNFHNQHYARLLRKQLDDHTQINDIYGIDYHEVPSVALETQPGDLVMWDFRTIHASFNGGERRRLFSINFRELEEGSRDQQRDARLPFARKPKG